MLIIDYNVVIWDFLDLSKSLETKFFSISDNFQIISTEWNKNLFI